MSGISFGELVRRVGHRPDRVKYVVSSRGIKPIARIGMYRVFDPADAAMVKAVCDRIEAERRGVPAVTA